MPDDTNAQGDVFLRDLETGLTSRVSVGVGGVEADVESNRPSISWYGQFIVFISDATNLVANDTNGVSDVFIRDRGPIPTALGIRSASPATGVPITVWASDLLGRTNGTTSFDRSYNLGTTASFTAPRNVGVQWFDRWEKDSVPVPGAQRTINVLMDAPHTIKAVFLTGYDVTITSTNPASGVPISVWQADKLGRRDGTTGFSRTYTQGTVASFTAPRVVGSNYFMRWDLNGSPWLATPTVSLTVWTTRTLNAVYGSGMVLTVQSSQNAVPIQVWTADKQGLSNGNTTFTRIYAPSTSVAMTAPATAGFRPFVRWEKDGVAVPGNSRTTTVTMDAAHTMRAVYAP